MCRSSSVRSETKRNGAKFLSLWSEREGFVSLVSLWSETVDFTCETKRKWSETKRKKQSKRNKAKICENKENGLFFSSFWSETKNTEAKQSKKKNIEAKRNGKKNTEAKNEAKRKMRKRNELKRKIPKRTEKYRSETKRKEKYGKRKEAKKFVRNFCYKMRNRSDRFASLWSEKNVKLNRHTLNPCRYP
jgi:hypothetical protein